ncbi:acyl-CoA dehydrogenase family protein [Saccharicrinis sp. FJH2]|uniref:acyl-CoA dehydrogenase family protein n=1 Tax=Saccharicrinis sp. FJH65 TaxID=3344659 RepID=UPI0035F4EA57
MDSINRHPLITDDHRNYREKIRTFAEKEIKGIARQLDKENRFSVELTKKMGKLGLLGIQIPKVYGGQELDTLSYIIAVEELARVDGSQAATIAAHNSLGLYPIYKYGTDAQKEKYLPKLASGDQLWAFGITEPTAGSDAQGVKTKAELQGDKWLINGSKIFITNSASDMSAGVTIQAVTGEKNGKPELSAILVDKDTKGFTRGFISGKLMWRAADTGRLFFQNSIVPKENLLGEKGQGARIMLETLDGGRLSIAAMGLGLAQGAYEMAKEYALNRNQFGRPISKFQTVAFKLADMNKKIELARNTLYNACWLKDQGEPFGREAAISKLYCSEIAKEVADEAVQIFGAYGLTDENDIERFYRDQRILQIGEGTSEILKLVISRHIGI